MSTIVISSNRSGREPRVVTLPETNVSMLRAELELMIDESTNLKKIAGAAALLVARLDRVSLSGGTAMAAFALAGLIESMPEDTVCEAMTLFNSGKC